MTVNIIMIPLVTLLLSCLQSVSSLPQTPVSQPSQSLKSGQAKFTSTLLKELETASSSNFVVSPHSLHSTFSQVLQGAGGRTQSQLEDVLGVTQGDSLVDQYRTLGTQLSRSGDGLATVKEANLLAVATGFKPKSDYSSDLLGGFQSEIREFNFGTDSANSVKEINNFVAEKTNDKIQELLAEGDVGPLTRLVLVNAVYFKANWKFAFIPKNTISDDFQSPSGPIQTEFMTRTSQVNVLEDAERELDILELPYSDPSKAMLIVLPREGVSSDGIVDRMDGLDLGDVRRNGRLANTEVIIPKFKLKYQTPLKEKMQKLGVRDLFSDAADLSGISDEGLSASEGVHQAFIEVNEEGTEAAAATAVAIGIRLATQKRRFHADRPFLFVVYDFDQDVALFAGKVVDPSNDKIIQRSASLTEIPNVIEPLEQPLGTSGDPKICGPLFRDFPNSLENKNVCESVENKGQNLKWLRKNRALCEESKDFFSNFMSNSCEALWCEEAAPLHSVWTQTANSDMCTGIENRVETQQVKQNCKNFANKLKAFAFLQCTT